MKTYLRHRIRNVIDIKDLAAVEYLDFEGKYRDYVETHDFWELCYVIDGQIVLNLDGKTLSVSDTDLVLIPPNKKHSYHSPKGNRNRAFVICFDSFSQALDAIGLHVFHLDSVQHACITRVMEECSTTFRMNESDHLEVLDSPCFGGQQALILQLEYLLISLVRGLSSQQNAAVVFFNDESFYADLSAAVQRFLRENLEKKLTLDEICERFSYSRSFLCKIFKEQTGETLFAYFNRLKIQEAKQLLTETSQSVGEIAGALGFREVKYFDSVFKKYTGQTPVCYRNENKK